MAEEAQVSPVAGRRAGDGGWMCVVALRMSQAWDWVDKRQIDAHVLTAFIAWGTWRLMLWATGFAETSVRPGMEVAAIVGAILVPWGAVQGFALKFYFDARR